MNGVRIEFAFGGLYYGGTIKGSYRKQKDWYRVLFDDGVSLTVHLDPKTSGKIWRPEVPKADGEGLAVAEGIEFNEKTLDEELNLNKSKKKRKRQKDEAEHIDDESIIDEAVVEEEAPPPPKRIVGTGKEILMARRKCKGSAIRAAKKGVCVAADTEKEGDKEYTKYLVQLSSDCTEHRFVVAH